MFGILFVYYCWRSPHKKLLFSHWNRFVQAIYHLLRVFPLCVDIFWSHTLLECLGELHGVPVKLTAYIWALTTSLLDRAPILPAHFQFNFRWPRAPILQGKWSFYWRHDALFTLRWLLNFHFHEADNLVFNRVFRQNVYKTILSHCKHLSCFYVKVRMATRLLWFSTRSNW